MGKPTKDDFEILVAKFSLQPNGDGRLVLSIKRNLPLSVEVAEFQVQHVTRASPSGAFAYHGGAVWKGGNEAGAANPEFVFDALFGVPIYGRDSDGFAVHPGPVMAGAEAWIRVKWKGRADGMPHGQSVRVVRVTV